MNMKKQTIKETLLITIIPNYFFNLLAMFFISQLEVLIANILLWIFVFTLLIGFYVIDWLGETRK